ncbi:MAG: pyridoxamine 5'-phosphate oxidase family protein [Chloroflexota bacterium]
MATTEPTPDAEALARSGAQLETDIIGWLTTLAPDGRLQTSPISFLWEDGTILFYSQPDTPKLRNIAAHPQVSFHLQSDPYGDHVLMLEGEARVDPATPPSDVHAAYAAKYREPLAHWGLDVAQTAREFSVPVRIRVTRTRAW